MSTTGSFSTTGECTTRSVVCINFGRLSFGVLNPISFLMLDDADSKKASKIICKNQVWLIFDVSVLLLLVRLRPRSFAMKNYTGGLISSNFE